MTHMATSKTARIPAEAERRLTIDIAIGQLTDTYSRTDVGTAKIVASYPLDLERVLAQVRETLGLVVGNVDVTFGAVPVVSDIPARLDAEAATESADAEEDLSSLPF